MYLTQANVEDELQRLMERMEQETGELAVLSIQAAEAEVEFKKSFAIAYTSGVGPVKDREQTATMASIDALRAHKRSDALVRSKQEALRTTRASLDALRTISANVRGMT